MLSGLFIIMPLFHVNPDLKVLASRNYKKRMSQKAKNSFPSHREIDLLLFSRSDLFSFLCES